MTTTRRPLVRVDMNLPTEVVEAVKAIAGERQISNTEVIRRAISILKFLEDQRADGQELRLLLENGGHLERIVFPWM